MTHTAALSWNVVQMGQTGASQCNVVTDVLEPADAENLSL